MDSYVCNPRILRQPSEAAEPSKEGGRSKLCSSRQMAAPSLLQSHLALDMAKWFAG